MEQRQSERKQEGKRNDEVEIAGVSSAGSAVLRALGRERRS